MSFIFLYFDKIIFYIYVYYFYLYISIIYFTHLHLLFNSFLEYNFFIIQLFSLKLFFCIELLLNYYFSKNPFKFSLPKHYIKHFIL